MTASDYWNGLIVAILLGAIVGTGLAAWQTRRELRKLERENRK